MRRRRAIDAFPHLGARVELPLQVRREHREELAELSRELPVVEVEEVPRGRARWQTTRGHRGGNVECARERGGRLMGEVGGGGGAGETERERAARNTHALIVFLRSSGTSRLERKQSSALRVSLRSASTAFISAITPEAEPMSPASSQTPTSALSST